MDGGRSLQQQQQQQQQRENAYHMVSANYNKISDHFRRLTPQGFQCCVFCGGVNCKYENPENWKPDSLALQGIYSHWITDNIMAMARPSTLVITKKNIIQQFYSLGIRSIFNLQTHREHASCGQPLEKSGFSYDPNIFMENGIYYYNFSWKDYGDASLANLLDMVKVLAFALSEGRVAIHCHAGLGRTGVLIACYLVYALRANANDAIRYVRYKRPGSVQTRGQILCVRLFAQYVLPRLQTYALGREKGKAEYTLKKFLKRQSIMLHGYEERNFRHIPKIVHVICERILKLCNLWRNDFWHSNTSFTKNFYTEKLFGILQSNESNYSINTIVSEAKSPALSDDPLSSLQCELDEEVTVESLLENKCFRELESEKSFRKDSQVNLEDVQETSDVVNALLIDVSDLSKEETAHMQQIEQEINMSYVGWRKIESEKNVYVLSALLFDWLETLKVPVLRMDYLEHIVRHYNEPEICFEKFDIDEAYLLEYVLLFLSKLEPVSNEELDYLINRFIGAFTQRSLLVKDKTVPMSRDFQKLRDGTLSCTSQFLRKMFQIIREHHKHNSSLNLSYLEKSTGESATEDWFGPENIP